MLVRDMLGRARSKAADAGEPTPHRRQLILFLAAILVPYAVLVALSVRLAVQERQLRQDGGAYQRREIAAEVGKELLAQLENIRSNEVLTPLAPGARYRRDETVLVGWVEEGRLVLPWEVPREPLPARIRSCEQVEYGPGGIERASRCYEEAAATASNPAEAAQARMLLARALERAGKSAAAVDLLRALLETPPATADEDGVPLRFYAAQQLLTSAGAPELVTVRLREALEALPWLPPIACFVAAEVADRLAAEDLRSAVAAHRRLTEEAEALQTDLSRVGILKRTGWTCYGEDMWLASAVQAPGGRTAVIAVRGAEMFRPLERERGVRFADAREPAGEALGANLPDLKIIVPSVGLESRSRGLERTLFYSSLCLLAAATMFAAWLLWRDLRRDLRLAEMRSQFVSSVSHELKTPLTAIRMLAETLQMGRGRDPQTEGEYLDTIVNECERLSRLVDGVLQFSKTEQGKKVYHFRPVSVEDAVLAAARAMEYPLSQKGFRLHMNIEPGLPPVRADRDALEQAILNLLGNAMKYSGEERDIELALGRRDGEIVIRVTDRGVGIAPEEQPRIFDKFYRARTPENQCISGTGLGLALVAQIVKAHGGRVQVDSAPGKGSTFSVCLPAEETA